MESWLHEFPSSVTQDEMMGLIARLNLATQVHGILVQMPLPTHLDEDEIVDAVAPLKDVDGFGPASLGLLAVGPAALPRLHALRRHADPVAQRHRRGRQVGRRRRPQQHRRQAAGADALAQGGRRHGDGVPQPDARRGGVHAPGRHRRHGHRPGGLPQGGHGAARGRRHRRGHEPAGRRHAGRATWTSPASRRSPRRSRRCPAASGR